MWKIRDRAGRKTLSFGDNQLLPTLFGEYGKNLVLLESLFGISLVQRGNEIHIEGEEGLIEKVEEVFRECYRRVESGEILDIEEIRKIGKRVLRGKEEGSRIISVEGRRSIELSAGQHTYYEELGEKELVFATGPAGSGKTFIAVSKAVEMLRRREVRRLVISRPALEAGERIGFLPGSIKEKVDPFLRPIYDALHEFLSLREVERYLEDGRIEIVPLAYMRGRTLRSSYIILDEGQNTTYGQMKMFLTRFGQGSRMVVTGDLVQSDLNSQTNGLVCALDILQGISEIGFVRLGLADIHRHSLVGKIISAYDDRGSGGSGGSGGSRGEREE